MRTKSIWGLAALIIAGLCLMAYLPLLGVGEQSGWMRFLGRFHILVLHFPIVCLALAFAVNLVGRLGALKDRLEPVADLLLVVGAASAVFSVATGSLLMVGEGHEGALMDRHRLLGLLVAILAVIASALRFGGEGMPKSRSRGWSTVALGCSCGLLVVAAHDGGSLVHGKDYLIAHAPPWLKSWVSPDKKAATGSDAGVETALVSRNTVVRYEEEIQPILSRYCYRCHDDEDGEGGIRLDELGPLVDTAHEVEVWRHVKLMLETTEMPPADARELPAEERSTFIAWVQSALEEVAIAKREENGSFPMRRLARREFNHTYQDLFAADANFVTSLPPDPVSEKGYDTTADLLMVSNVDLQLYLETARNALDKYVHFGDRSDVVDRYFLEAEDIYHYCRGVGLIRAMEVAPRPLPADEFADLKRLRSGKPPVYNKRQYGPLPFGEIPIGDVPGVGEGRGFARQHEQFLLINTERRAGEVVVRIHAAATRGADGSYPVMRLEAGRNFDQLLKTLTAGEHTVYAHRDSPGVYEFRFRLEDALPPLANEEEEGPSPFMLLVISNVARHEFGALGGSGFGQGDIFTDGGIELHPGIVGQTEQGIISGRRAKKRWREGSVNYLHLDALEVEIVPVESDPRSPWIVQRPSQADEELTVARDVLERFAKAAFRRNVEPSELQRFVALYKDLREDGFGFEDAVRDTLSSVLVTQPFLFIGRPKAVSEDTRVVDLASRLSYFIWSSMPDERLVDLGAVGALVDPKVLSEEVMRMLEDPRANRFVDHFSRQWLGLEKLKDVVISEEEYPEFDSELAELAKHQTIETFRDVFINDRDARDLFRSRAMILNDQLSRHYGFEPLVGREFRRIEVGEGTKNWGGILSHASVLAINSDGRDSHPIKRGVWLLEKILDDPPPPPPPVVPEIDESDPEFAALSLKEKIEHHREVHSCSGCHGKIDPWGIAFEEYDATGRWRDTASAPRAIDASTILPDGEEIPGFKALTQYLLSEREEQMMLSLVKHMMTYALGRDLDVLDEREAARILHSFKISGYSMKHLVMAIAQSDAFKQTTPKKDNHG